MKPKSYWYTLVFLLAIFSFSTLACNSDLDENSCDTRSEKYLRLQLFLSLIRSNQSFCGGPSLANSSQLTLYPGISVSTPNLGYTLKNGGQDTVTFRLTKESSASVTLPLTVSATSQATISPSTLTFTTTNWNTAQTVTVTGLDNTNYGVSANFTINYGPTVSSDSTYHGLSGSSSSIANRDHRKLIFGSNLTQGNLGGISGADSLCNGDSNKPANTGTYKAFIVLPGVRVASISPNAGDGQIDWVLLPNQLYTRPDGTVIMTTNSVAIFTTFPLVNSVYTTGDAIWTGFTSASDWTAAGGCSNWLSTGATGPYSVANSVGFQSLLFGGNITGTNNNRLYCVQQ